MEKITMHRFIAAVALALVAFLVAHPVLAQIAPAVQAPVTVPWGDVTIAVINGLVAPILASLIGALAVWLFAQIVRFVPWLKRYVTAQLIERLLTNAMDFALNAVTDAAKGKTMTVSTGRVVLDTALRRAVEVGSPAIIKAAGGKAELAAMIFRKLDLEPAANARTVLSPVLTLHRVARISSH